MSQDSILVSFVVIALNAEATLPSLFECLQRQTYSHNLIEVILVDSDSSDCTKTIMGVFAENATQNGFKRAVVLDNPKKTLPCGWNVALRAVAGDAILRVDAHTNFPDDFVEKNVNNIESGEDICGGKVISVPAHNTKWNIVLNEAENSMFGGSFAAFRHADTKGYVSTAAFAIYRKSVFDKVGEYNELLTRTEDNEMHYRMKKAGYRFFYDPDIVSYRETRGSLSKLLKQKYLNGYWIGRTLGVEPHCFSLYHFVPLAFVLAIILSTLMAIAGVSLPTKILWGAYAIVNIIMAIVACVSCKNRNVEFISLPLLFLLLHLWYGVGTLVGFIEMIKNKITFQNGGGYNQDI